MLLCHPHHEKRLILFSESSCSQATRIGPTGSEAGSATNSCRSVPCHPRRLSLSKAPAGETKPIRILVHPRKSRVCRAVILWQPYSRHHIEPPFPPHCILTSKKLRNQFLSCQNPDNQKMHFFDCLWFSSEFSTTF